MHHITQGRCLGLSVRLGWLEDFWKVSLWASVTVWNLFCPSLSCVSSRWSLKEQCSSVLINFHSSSSSFPFSTSLSLFLSPFSRQPSLCFVPWPVSWRLSNGPGWMEDVGLWRTQSDECSLYQGLSGWSLYTAHSPLLSTLFQPCSHVFDKLVNVLSVMYLSEVNHRSFRKCLKMLSGPDCDQKSKRKMNAAGRLFLVLLFFKSSWLSWLSCWYST